MFTINQIEKTEEKEKSSSAENESSSEVHGCARVKWHVILCISLDHSLSSASIRRGESYCSIKREQFYREVPLL